MSLKTKILEVAKEVEDAAGRKVKALDDDQAAEFAGTNGADVPSIYLAALKAGVWPVRYLRNRESISLAEQTRLAESVVGVIGAGGLGGQVILQLARMGIGHLRVVDGDVFEESNLNRQMLSSRENLGRSKAQVAAETVAGINPGVVLTPCAEGMTTDNAPELLKGLHVVVDALDTVRDRLILSRAAQALSIPLVHGTVAGFEGRVMTIFPEDPGLEILYGQEAPPDKDSDAPEAVLGTPPFAPALVATLQAMEVVKIILDRGDVYRKKMVYVDLEQGQWDIFRF